MPSPFATFEKSFHDIAQEWPLRHPITSLPCENEHDRFKIAADASFDETVDTCAGLPDKLRSDSARHGVRVLFRYCHLASMIGAKQGMGVDELTQILRSPESFEQLAKVASNQKRVTSRIETELGLVPFAYGVGDWNLSNWEMTEQSLNIRQYPLLQAISLRDVMEQQHDVYDGQCAAHASGSLEPIFQSVVTIAATDENLFNRTLSS